MKHLWHTALQQLPLSYLVWIIPRQIATYSCKMKQINADSAQLLIFMITDLQTDYYCLDYLY